MRVGLYAVDTIHLERAGSLNKSDPDFVCLVGQASEGLSAVNGEVWSSMSCNHVTEMCRCDPKVRSLIR